MLWDSGMASFLKNIRNHWDDKEAQPWQNDSITSKNASIFGIGVITFAQVKSDGHRSEVKLLAHVIHQKPTIGIRQFLRP